MRPQLFPGVRRKRQRGRGSRAGGCMDSRVGGTGAGRRCPRLAADLEELDRPLSPAEGFLLSRIDGHTPWTVLREIGGLAPRDADAALARWIAIGLVDVDGDKPDPGPAYGADAGPDLRSAVD